MKLNKKMKKLIIKEKIKTLHFYFTKKLLLTIYKNLCIKYIKDFYLLNDLYILLDEMKKYSVIKILKEIFTFKNNLIDYLYDEL